MPQPPNRARPPSPPFAPDPQVVTKIVALLPQIKIAIVAADFHLTAMSPFVTHSKLTLPSGPFNEGAKFSIRLVDLFFDLSKLQDPKPSFDRLVTAFRNMKVALNRNFETGIPNLPSLFVPNKLAFMEKQATARERVGTGQISEGGVSLLLHVYLLFCVVCFTPMKFPRIKAEGQSFLPLRFQSGRPSNSFSRPPTTVPQRPKDLCYERL